MNYRDSKIPRETKIHKKTFKNIRSRDLEL